MQQEPTAGRQTYITAEQKRALLNFVGSHLELKSSKFSKDFTFKHGQVHWGELANKLNAIPGAHKSGSSGGSRRCKMSKIVFFGLLAVSVIALTESLDCYKCSGPVGSDCAKGVISAMSVETCSNDNQNGCKVVDLSGVWTGRSISRRCHDGTSCENMKYLMDIGIHSCVECLDNLCNSAAV
ncbi:hypothetical protein FQR65_LT04303 [Abscondita terminalis]|nr:hypothetical protein FQR65_LT04303 [Abscondita terminalis]